MATHGADRTGSGRRMNAPQRHASLQKYARLESPPISSRATSVAGASRRVSSVHRKSSSHTSRHSRHTADALTRSSASSRPNIRSHNATSIATLDRTKPRARLIGLAGKPGFAGVSSFARRGREKLGVQPVDGCFAKGVSNALKNFVVEP